jgi:glycosyltransferase involved in cell wall biosynthesis
VGELGRLKPGAFADVPSLLLELEKLKVPHSGLGQVCLNLGEHLVRQRPPDWDLTLYVPEARAGVFGEARGLGYLPHSGLHRLLPATRAPVDVWHCIHQESRYPPPRRDTRLVLTIHDLNFLQKYTGLRRARHLAAVQRLVDRATTVTFISRFTESDVRAHLRLDGKATRVIYGGNSLRVQPAAPRPPFAPPGPFLFTIGIVGPKKNFHVLVPFLRALGPGRSLVIAGDASGPYAERIRRLARDEGVADRVLLPGAVDDAQRYWLYANCEALLFPSLAEGFGLPVIEAMSVGKPVFASTRTSLPEAGGAEAYYWPDFDPRAMREVFERGMAEVRADPGKAERLRRWADRFSWERCARAFWEVYEEARSSPSAAISR